MRFSFTAPSTSFKEIDQTNGVTYKATLSNGYPLPSWLNCDTATGVLSGLPDPSDRSSFDVSITATDVAGQNSSVAFRLLQHSYVSLEAVPGMDEASAQNLYCLQENTDFNAQIPSQFLSAPELGDIVSISSQFEDYDSNGTLQPDWFHFDPSTATLTAHPSSADAGRYWVLINVQYAGGTTVSYEFQMAVGDAYFPSAPVLANPIPDQTAAVGSEYTFVVPNDTFQDSNPGDQRYLVVTLEDGNPLPSWLNFNIGQAHSPANQVIQTSGTCGSKSLTMTMTTYLPPSRLTLMYPVKRKRPKPIWVPVDPMVTWPPVVPTAIP